MTKETRTELRRSFPARLAVWGLVLIPSSLVVSAVAGNLTGSFNAIPPLALLAAVVAALLSRGRALIPSLVVSVLALLAYVVLEILGGLFQFMHPDSFADFVPALMRAVGSLMAFTGTVVALRRRRHHSLRPTRPVERIGLRATAAALVVIAGLSAVLTYRSGSDAGAPQGAIVVDMYDDVFDPSEVRAGQERTVRLFLRNTDSYAHTFTVDAIELDVYVGPQASRSVGFEAPEPGSYDLYCAVTGHEDMVGTLVIG